MLKTKLLFSLLLIFWALNSGMGQEGQLAGTLTLGDQPLATAQITLLPPGESTYSDENGRFRFNGLSAGAYELVVSYLGEEQDRRPLVLEAEEEKAVSIRLPEDLIQLNEIVVSASREQISKYESPVVVHTIGQKTIQAVNAISVADASGFTPGVRVENNCQNCGFTQLRMNGLGGQYSQILINSRPVFSALAGVYGLEMLPASMVEKIEVVRGAGSVLYGGNAIAGTVNIRMREPVINSYSVEFQNAWTGLEQPDRNIQAHANIVHDDGDKGVSIFVADRKRAGWDANGDGITEITELENTSFGLNAFWNLSSSTKLKAGMYRFSEYRRGGSQLDRPPHLSSIAEQLDHAILGGHLDFEHGWDEGRQRISAYASFQTVDRDSYYGIGGRQFERGDSIDREAALAINAYGVSSDLSWVTGSQYSIQPEESLTLTLGAEHKTNAVEDQMPAYRRSIEQRVSQTGIFAQLDYSPVSQLQLLLGGRYEWFFMQGNYALGDFAETEELLLPVFVPRVAIRYRPHPDIQVRASYARGYRGPQAFDEDLHVETVGGAARFVSLSPDLQPEKSASYNASFQYTSLFGNHQFNAVLEGFYTELRDPFILAGQRELEPGLTQIQRRNGEGADVYGLNLELQYAFSPDWVVQSGMTLQEARYRKEEIIWEPTEDQPDLPVARTEQILRSPNLYGYAAIRHQLSPSWDWTLSANHTGPMQLAHLIDPATQQTVIKTSPHFLDVGLRIAKTISLQKNLELELFAGTHNLFNSYQDDFDQGVDRDANYIYGPSRPRTIYAGVKLGME